MKERKKKRKEKKRKKKRKSEQINIFSHKMKGQHSKEDKN
jgi:hypothetical protein